MSIVIQFLYAYFVFLFSVVIHEAAHALAAHRLGDDTAYHGGQVSLDPLPHIQQEPFGTVLVPVLSFFSGGWIIGWASAPYDLRWALSYPKRSALMALAGPLANLAVVVVTGVVIRLGVGFHVFDAPDMLGHANVVTALAPGVMQNLAALLGMFFSMNLLLFTFNMLPLGPLDGSGVVPLFLGEEKAQQYMLFVKEPTMMFLGMLLAWKLMDGIYDPVFNGVTNLLYLGVAQY